MNATESRDHPAHAVRARARHVPRQLPPLRAEGDRPAHRALARAGLRRSRGVPQERRARLSADVGRRKVRRRRHPRLPLRAGHDRGEPALRRHRVLQHAALTAGRPVSRRARQRGAEAAVPAALRPGRMHPGDRDDRVGRGQRSRRHEDARRGSRRPLGDQRLEDVHLERADRRPRSSSRRARCRTRRTVSGCSSSRRHGRASSAAAI